MILFPHPGRNRLQRCLSVKFGRAVQLFKDIRCVPRSNRRFKIETWTKHHEMTWLVTLAMYYKIFQEMSFQKHRFLQSQQTERRVASSSSINICARCNCHCELRKIRNSEIQCKGSPCCFDHRMICCSVF